MDDISKNRSPDAPWLDAYIESLEEFRKHSKDVTVSQVLTFLYIAREPGITQTETLKMLGLVTGGSSRIVAELSKFGDRKDRPGWNVIDLFENPNDRRFKMLRLTHKGDLIMNTVRSAVRRSCEAMAGAMF